MGFQSQWILLKLLLLHQLALIIVTRIQPHPKRLPQKELNKGVEGRLIQHGDIVHKLLKEEERSPSFQGTFGQIPW